MKKLLALIFVLFTVNFAIVMAWRWTGDLAKSVFNHNLAVVRATPSAVLMVFVRGDETLVFFYEGTPKPSLMLRQVKDQVWASYNGQKPIRIGPEQVKQLFQVMMGKLNPKVDKHIWAS